jgi:hypothetical protein
MSDDNAPGPDFSTPLPADAPAEFSSPSSAANYLAGLWEKRNKEQNSSAESAPDATAEQESAGEADAAPPEEEATGETQEADPAAEPPLDLPRSWTKEQAEHWKALPRATQEYLTERASKDSETVRRVQNEAAEKLKALETEYQAVAKARSDLEEKAKANFDALQEFSNQNYAQIKSQGDVDIIVQAISQAASGGDLQRATELQAYLNGFYAHNHKLVAAQADMARATQEKDREHETAWAKYVHEENEKAVTLIPDLADATKKEALTKRVISEVFPDLGFKDGEIARLATGKDKLSLFDHRIQRLLADHLELKDLRAAPKALAAKTLPPVQKPGTARPAGAAQSERIQALTRQLNETGDLKAAQELRALQLSRRAS